MTDDQIEQFFAHVKSLRDRALFSLLYGSGIRISEALSLDVKQVRLADGEILSNVVDEGRLSMA